jgi:hypothetical protein
MFVQFLSKLFLVNKEKFIANGEIAIFKLSVHQFLANSTQTAQ